MHQDTQDIKLEPACTETLACPYSLLLLQAALYQFYQRAPPAVLQRSHLWAWSWSLQDKGGFAWPLMGSMRKESEWMGMIQACKVIKEILLWVIGSACKRYYLHHNRFGYTRCIKICGEMKERKGGKKEARKERKQEEKERMKDMWQGRQLFCFKKEGHMYAGTLLKTPAVKSSKTFLCGVAVLRNANHRVGPIFFECSKLKLFLLLLSCAVKGRMLLNLFGKGVMTVMMCFGFSWQEGGHWMGPLGFSRQPCHCGLGWWQAWQSTVGNSAYVGWGGNTSKLRRGLPPQPREHEMKHHNSQEPLYDGVLWSMLCQKQMNKIFQNDIRRQ